MDGQRQHEIYDLDVLLPVSANGKYAERMKAFQRFGLLNNSRASIRITLLIGTEDAELFAEGWHCPVRMVSSQHHHPAAKIYDFYARADAEEADMARWLIRVDDDSVTDVDGLIQWLDACYDWRECHYLMTGVVFDCHPVYREALANLGYDHLLRPSVVGSGAHEFESALLSQTMMRRILRHPDSRRLFAACAEFEGGYGDHVLPIAARIVGFTPAQSEVLWCYPELGKFSIFGGDFYHIHFLAPDLDRWSDFVNLCGLYGFQKHEAEH